MHLIRGLRKYPSLFLRQKGHSNRLSSHTSGHKHFREGRVDKVNCRMEKCILLERLRKYQSVFVRQNGRGL